MMKGTIRKVKDAIFVEYVTRADSSPEETTMRWRQDRVSRSPYHPAWPEDGDEVQSIDGGWNGPGYTVYAPGDRQAESSETRPIPCPKVKAGTETRYVRGRWEKYLKTKGWVSAE